MSISSSVCLPFCVCHLSFSLILWWKQQCVECFIPWESGNHVTRWLTLFKAAPLMLLWDSISVSCSLCLSLALWSSLHGPHAHRHSSSHLLFFVCLPSPSLPRLISLHPILCVWVEGGDSVQARLLLWRLQHHLSLRGERGHPWQPAHCWWYSHHWPNGKTMIAVLAQWVEVVITLCNGACASFKSKTNILSLSQYDLC